MQDSKNKLDVALLGKIVFARFLENSLPLFRRIVSRVESSAEFFALSPWVTVGRLADARATDGSVDKRRRFPSTLGEVREVGGCLHFLYHCKSHTREYVFDETELCRLQSSREFPRQWAKAVHRLRLINSRNRLTHAVVKALLEAQAEYLFSGKPLALRPLTQEQLSTRLRGQPGLSPVADAGRISRLVRGLSILSPSGRVIPVGELLPNARRTHCHFVDCVIKKEMTWVEQGVLEAPLPDQAIAQILERENGVRLSRRTVAHIRRALAIPDYRRRAERANYLTATAGFSALIPLTPQALRSVVPTYSGVYEIRSGFHSKVGSTKSGTCEARIAMPDLHHVVYIGSAADLRKRLTDHLRGSSGNDLLYRFIAGGAAQVRYRAISDRWRWVERELYRKFCETFGAPPLANRMSP